MDISKLEEQIAKTGFVLENAIAQSLKKSGWTTISNRFYVDDLEGTVREIDLVAYRVTKVQKFNVYTSLIISCKKSEANAWTLLSRKNDLSDPNADWWPLHVWTNDKAIDFQVNGPDFGKKYHREVARRGAVEALQTPSVEVFAFQEMSRASGAPQNDKAIFNAITSLMKAQSYELKSLPLRRKDAAVYQFNLISVVDADLVRLNFSGSKIKAEEIGSEHYIARYIIQNKETFARIRFIKADEFDASLRDYGRLHSANCEWFSEQCDLFYEDILTDWERTSILEEEFRKRLGFAFTWRIKHLSKNVVDIKDVSLEWRANSKSVAVTGPFSASTLKLLSSDSETSERVKKALKEIYRYGGKFFFDDNSIPF